MAAIDQYIERIPNAELQEQLRIEIARLTKKKRFGLVYENHLPDNVIMPEVAIRRGTKVALRGATPNDVYEVQSISEGEVTCALVQDVESEMARQLTTGIDTRTATFNLKGWEPITLAEERKHPQYVCWLRNQDRKPWALCIPYEYGNEMHRMYPDFIIVRSDGNDGYEYSLLEPHRDDKKDNLAKAKGLAKYVQECPNISRVQMLRKVHDASGDRMLRLDFCKLAVRNKVLNCVTDADFDIVFNSEGEYDI